MGVIKRRVQLSLKPNPLPLPYKGRGARFKASLRFGATVYTQVLKSYLTLGFVA